VGEINLFSPPNLSLPLSPSRRILQTSLSLSRGWPRQGGPRPRAARRAAGAAATRDRRRGQRRPGPRQRRRRPARAAGLR